MLKMNPVYEDIHKFIAVTAKSGFPASKYFYPEGLTVYLRVCQKVVDREIKQTITIANVSNHSTSELHIPLDARGHFQSLMKFLESICPLIPLNGIFFESVLSPRLSDVLEKNDYILLNEHGDMNYYKPLL